jgi:hypothetical protein
MTLNAERERAHCVRVAEFNDRECLIARYKWNDEVAARIYETGADRWREQAEMWKRILIGAK